MALLVGIDTLHINQDVRILIFLLFPHSPILHFLRTHHCHQGPSVHSCCQGAQSNLDHYCIVPTHLGLLLLGTFPRNVAKTAQYLRKRHQRISITILF
jgi:hypothetical protein